MGCVICGHDQFKTIVEEDGFKYGMCKRCNHVQQEVILSPEEYLELPYDSQWHNYDTHSRNRAQYIYEFINGGFLAYWTWTPTICDVGCGWGGPLKYMKEWFRSPEAFGITPNIDNKTTEWNKDLNIEYTDFETHEVTKKYDLVTMVHTLEHMVDPRKCLDKIRQLVSSNGLVYIEVPSFDWASVRTDPWYTPVHVSYFSKKILQKIVEEAGLEIVKIKESKYWGNIKVLARPVDSQPVRRYINRRSILLWKLKKVLIHPLYRLLHKIKKVSPND